MTQTPGLGPVDPAPDGSGGPSLASTPRDPRRTRNAAIAVIAAVIVIAAVVVGVLVSGSDKKNDAGPAAASSSSQATVSGSSDGSGSGVAMPAGAEADTYGVKVGDSSAPVRVDFYEDFQCTYCHQLETQIGSTVTQAIDDKKIVAYYHVLSFVDDIVGSQGVTDIYSKRAGNIALCAADEGKFDAMHNKLYANYPGEGQQAANVTDDTLLGWAREVGLDSSSYTDCFKANKYTPFMAAGYTAANQMAAANGMNGIATPAIFINGKQLQIGAMVNGKVVYDPATFTTKVTEATKDGSKPTAPNPGSPAASAAPSAASPSPAEPQPSKSAKAVPSAIDDATHAVRVGDPKAPVRIDVFEDGSCSHCKTFASNHDAGLHNLAANGKAVVYYHLLAFLDRGDTSGYSHRSAQVGLCAAKESQFDKVQDVLWANQGATSENLVAAAKAAGVSSPTFATCATSSSYTDFTAKAYEYADSVMGAGKVSTPTVYINGKVLDFAGADAAAFTSSSAFDALVAEASGPASAPSPAK